jgi:hypothetical protein
MTDIKYPRCGWAGEGNSFFVQKSISVRKLPRVSTSKRKKGMKRKDGIPLTKEFIEISFVPLEFLEISYPIMKPFGREFIKCKLPQAGERRTELRMTDR